MVVHDWLLSHYKCRGNAQSHVNGINRKHVRELGLISWHLSRREKAMNASANTDGSECMLDEETNDDAEEEEDFFSMAVKELSETNRRADEIARVRHTNGLGIGGEHTDFRNVRFIPIRL